MNFRQDEEHQDILEMVHDFAVNEVKPLAAEIDRTEAVSYTHLNGWPIVEVV